jgi:hypothetical protein
MATWHFLSEPQTCGTPFPTIFIQMLPGSYDHSLMRPWGLVLLAPPDNSILQWPYFPQTPQEEKTPLAHEAQLSALFPVLFNWAFPYPN